MLTDYVVTCPHDDCHWSGSLFPSTERDAWRSALPSTHTATFCCPHCGKVWRARVVGDDVFPLLETEAAQAAV